MKHTVKLLELHSYDVFDDFIDSIIYSVIYKKTKNCLIATLSYILKPIQQVLFSNVSYVKYLLNYGLQFVYIIINAYISMAMVHKKHI